MYKTNIIKRPFVATYKNKKEEAKWWQHIVLPFNP
jgi:hypothetical protein